MFKRLITMIARQRNVCSFSHHHGLLRRSKPIEFKRVSVWLSVRSELGKSTARSLIRQQACNVWLPYLTKRERRGRKAWYADKTMNIERTKKGSDRTVYTKLLHWCWNISRVKLSCVTRGITAQSQNKCGKVSKVEFRCVPLNNNCPKREQLKRYSIRSMRRIVTSFETAALLRNFAASLYTLCYDYRHT